MKSIPISRFACGRVLDLLDAFVDNELLARLRQAAFLKLLLRSAVEQVEVPVYLRRNLTRLIRASAVN
jgi:hypothetical protein